MGSFGGENIWLQRSVLEIEDKQVLFCVLFSYFSNVWGWGIVQVVQGVLGIVILKVK